MCRIREAEMFHSRRDGQLKNETRWIDVKNRCRL
jgi:hypothetical protein